MSEEIIKEEPKEEVQEAPKADFSALASEFESKLDGKFIGRDRLILEKLKAGSGLVSSEMIRVKRVLDGSGIKREVKPLEEAPVIEEQKAE